jgi:hypothetical protein
MFYCEPCGRANGWPCYGVKTSVGPCEVCGTRAACFDVHHAHLPADTSRDEPRIPHWDTGGQGDAA